MKTVLLTSSSLANKGDALMLQAVTERLGPRFRYAIPANVAFDTPNSVRRFLICLTTDRPAWSVKRWVFNNSIRGLGAVSRFIPQPLTAMAHVIRDEDIDIAIDLSGYCFGDHWGEAMLEQAIRQYARYKRRGVPVILMPKTWGPFEKLPRHRVNALIDSVDLAFARDHTSLELLRSCLDSRNCEKVAFAPDYTHAVGEAPSQLRHRDANNRTVYIIPSYRVIDSGTLTKPEYLRLLAKARSLLAAGGANPVLLIHEAASDHAFLRAAAEMGFASSETITEDDPVKLKATIARSSGVITSRLHGLYNALNSCVPVLAIPWNFKYEEALKQYDCERLLVDMARPSASLEEKVPLLLSPAERRALSATMSIQRDRMKSFTDEMWTRIEETLAPVTSPT